jgi:hypothetical protein
MNARLAQYLGSRAIGQHDAPPVYDPAFETCACSSPREHELGGCWGGAGAAALDRGEAVELCSCDESAELRRELAAQRTIAARFEQRIERAIAIATAPATPRLMGDGGAGRLERVVGALRGDP